MSKKVNQVYIKVIEQDIEEYLKTVPVDKGEDWYDSYWGFAERELSKFLEWVKNRDATPPPPD